MPPSPSNAHVSAALSQLGRAQVLAEARAVDDLYAAGKDIKPLCGLAFAVKDNIDVVG